jgi:hypothetical protein
MGTALISASAYCGVDINVQLSLPESLPLSRKPGFELLRAAHHSARRLWLLPQAPP